MSDKLGSSQIGEVERTVRKAAKEGDDAAQTARRLLTGTVLEMR
jgi:hypothetical protein